MEAVDMNKLDIAIKYIQRIADGCNPVSNAPMEEVNIKKISPQTVTAWLKNAGYLTVEYSPEVGKESTMPTEKGRALGIYTGVRNYSNNTYLVVIYNQNAQEFLVKNLEAIVNGEVIE